MENIQQIVSIISSIFIIIIITKIVEFLKSVPNCECAKIADTGILDKIVFLEKAIIGLMAIQIIRRIYEMSTSIKVDKLSKMNSPFNLFIFAVAFLVYVFFVYNVNNFKNALSASTGSKESCECIDKWQKTALYIQAIIYMIVVSVILILGIFLVNISLRSGIGSNFTNVMVLLVLFAIGLGIWSFYGGDVNFFLEYAMDAMPDMPDMPQFKEGFHSDCASCSK